MKLRILFFLISAFGVSGVYAQASNYNLAEGIQYALYSDGSTWTNSFGAVNPSSCLAGASFQWNGTQYGFRYAGVDTYNSSPTTAAYWPVPTSITNTAGTYTATKIKRTWLRDVNCANTYTYGSTQVVGTFTITVLPKLIFNQPKLCSAVSALDLNTYVNRATGVATFYKNGTLIPGGILDVTALTVGTNYTIKGRYDYSQEGFDGATLSTYPAYDEFSYLIAVTQSMYFATHPANTSFCPGGSGSLSLNVVGAGFGLGTATYQWQYWNGSIWTSVTNGTIGGTTFAGATTNSLTLTNVAASYNGTQYRCGITGYCNTAYSNAATISEYGQVGITGSPANSKICSGGNTTFTASGTANNGSLSYVWQLSTNGGSSFSNISNGGVYSGATTATLTLTGATSAMANYQYRCVLSDACANVTSNTTASGTLTFNTDASVSVHPGNASACVSGNATFSVTGAGTATLTYQWQESNDGGTSYNTVTNGGIYSGATTNTLTITGIPTAAYNGYRYRCRVTNLCNTAVSNYGTLSTVTAPAVTSDPANKTVCANTSASFTVAATGTSLAYKWQYSSSGSVGTFSDISGASSATYTIPSSTVSDVGYYRCVVSNSCSSTNSGSGSLTVNANTNISAQPSNKSVCPDGSTTFTATASGTGSVTFQWQESTNGGTSYSNLANGGKYSGATTATLSVSTIISGMNNYRYRVIVHSDCGSDVTSSHGLLTVNVIPSVPTAIDVARCGDGSLSATASSVASSPTYKWYANESDVSSIFTGATYTISSLTVSQTKYVTVTSNGCESIKEPVVYTRNAPQSVPLGGPLNLCVGQGIYNLEADITDAVAVGSNFTWTANSTNFSSKNFDPSVGAGSYTVSYDPPTAAKATPNCYIATNRTVTVVSSAGEGGLTFSGSEVSGGNTVNTCVGNAPITISTFPSSSGGSWSTVSGSGISSSGTATVFTPTNSNYTATTPNVFRYTVNIGGCSATKDLSIYVKDNTSSPVISGVASIICPATEINATASVTASGTFSYTWYHSGETSPFHTGNILTYMVANSESIEVRSTNTFACLSNATFVNINTPFASGVIGLDKSDINVGDNVSFNYNVTTSGNTHAWTFGDGGKSTEKNPIHYYYAPGDFVASLVVTSTLGCSQTLTYSTIKVNGTPIEIITSADDPLTALKEVTAFPMPFEGALSLDAEMNIGKINLQLVSMTGSFSISKEIDIQAGTNEIVSQAEGSQIPSGIYILKLQNKSLVQTIKVIKK